MSEKNAESADRLASPGGEYVWVVSAYEVRMSHWIEAGALFHVDRPGAPIFSAPDSWSFETRTWRSDTLLELEGRKYPGAMPGLRLTIDARRELGSIALDDLAALHARGSYGWVRAHDVQPAPEGMQPLREISRWLDAYPSERAQPL